MEFVVQETKHHTEETKRKMSESSKGQIPWNKGKKCSQISEALRGHKYFFRSPLSRETKEKIRNTLKKAFLENKLIPWWIKRNEPHPMQREEIIKNHPCYKGGRTPPHHLRLLKQSWKKIIKNVYKRDNYTCQECGKRGGLLHAHHILPYSLTKDNSLINLITYCNRCHPQIEKELMFVFKKIRR